MDIYCSTRILVYTEVTTILFPRVLLIRSNTLNAKEHPHI